MNNKNVLVIYGGSFNPILYSHITLAKEVLNKYDEVKKVVFVPVSSKYQKKDLAGDSNRYEMIKLAIEGNENLLVSDIELKSKQQLKTIETLEKIKEEYKNYEIWFMMGTDNLKELNMWEKPEKILKDFKIVVAERDDDNLNEIIEQSELLKKYKNSIKNMESKVEKNMSSTYVRKKIKNGESIRGLLPEKVREYIEKNNLYK